MNYWLMQTGAIHVGEMHSPLKGMSIEHLVQRNDDIRLNDRAYLFMYNVGVFGWGSVDEIKANPEQIQGNVMQTVTITTSEIGAHMAPIDELHSLPEFADILSRFNGNFVSMTPQMVNSLHGLIRKNYRRCPPDVSEIEDKRDRITENFRILWDIAYVEGDLRDALSNPSEVPVAVIYADMDSFKPINDTYGHDAGDEVMKGYLKSVQAAVAPWGNSYRGRGDETVSIIVGYGQDQVSGIANDICHRVRSLQIEYKGKLLPKVTASVGLATSPPAARSRELLTLADGAQMEAKRQGKDRVVEH